MKSIKLIAIVACLFGATACQTVKTATDQQMNIATASIQFSVSEGLGLVLQNNPNYVPAVQAVNDAVSGVLLAAGGVTQQSADNFVAGIALKYPMDVKTQKAIANVLVDAYQFYVQAFKPTVTPNLDPNAVKLVQAVQAGITQAINHTK